VDDKITVSVKQESGLAVDITVHGPDLGSGPELIGYLSITRVPKGVSVEGFNADDSPVGGHMILHGDA
jgi:hypothetical protein